ncbi:MAG: ArsA family ATPase [Acidimicrobiales bacterium]
MIVCAGSGGVGKTTVAACLALEAARRGRRACVVTIDPARRLADALGLDSLSNDAHLLDGEWPGELWALMLDAKGTFDDLVDRYAGGEAQAEAIKSNSLYRNLSTALSGTQEYMAAEKLYALHQDDRFDVVVVDTPPARDALDFLEAPARLTRLLENRIFRLLVLPTRAYLRAVSFGVRAFLRSLSSVVGTEVIDDTVAFFQAFEGMEEGFRLRAARVAELLASPATSFLLVTSPRPDSVAEAAWFSRRLAEAGLSVAAVVANRVQPRFRPPSSPVLPDPAGVEEPLRSALVNLAQLESAAAREDEALEELAGRSGAPIRRVPLLGVDVHDLGGLALVGEHLTRGVGPFG